VGDDKSPTFTPKESEKVDEREISVCEAAREALQRWNEWVEADGFGNPEFDCLFDAMERLSAALGEVANVN
jgi:ribosomal protein RSM22 (predicted rRNA methylase)